MFVNDMSSPIHRALHYVECYALHFPDSGARDVAQELLSLLENRLTPVAAEAASVTASEGDDTDRRPAEHDG